MLGDSLVLNCQLTGRLCQKPYKKLIVPGDNLFARIEYCFIYRVWGLF